MSNSHTRTPRVTLSRTRTRALGGFLVLSLAGAVACSSSSSSEPFSEYTGTWRVEVPASFDPNDPTTFDFDLNCPDNTTTPPTRFDLE